jgi:phosphatidylinositol alpha-1,6-mannosyltransferase
MVKKLIMLKDQGLTKRLLKVLNNVEKVIANSKYTKNLAIELGVNQDKIIVINPGIDPIKDLDQKSLDKG